MHPFIIALIFALIFVSGFVLGIVYWQLHINKEQYVRSSWR